MEIYKFQHGSCLQVIKYHKLYKIVQKIQFTISMIVCPNIPWRSSQKKIVRMEFMRKEPIRSTANIYGKILE